MSDENVETVALGPSFGSLSFSLCQEPDKWLFDEMEE